MTEKYYLGTCPICSLSLEDRDTILTAFTLNLCPLTSSESLGLPGCPATFHQSFTLNFDDYFTQSPLSSNLKYFLPLLHSQLTSVPVSLRKQKQSEENFHTFPLLLPPFFHLYPYSVSYIVDKLSIALFKANLFTCALDPFPFAYSRSLQYLRLLSLHHQVFLLY